MDIFVFQLKGKCDEEDSTSSITAVKDIRARSVKHIHTKQQRYFHAVKMNMLYYLSMLSVRLTVECKVGYETITTPVSLGPTKMSLPAGRQRGCSIIDQL